MRGVYRHGPRLVHDQEVVVLKKDLRQFSLEEPGVRQRRELFRRVVRQVHGQYIARAKAVDGPHRLPVSKDAVVIRFEVPDDTRRKPCTASQVMQDFAVLVFGWDGENKGAHAVPPDVVFSGSG